MRIEAFTGRGRAKASIGVGEGKRVVDALEDILGERPQIDWTSAPRWPGDGDARTLSLRGAWKTDDGRHGYWREVA